MQGTRVSSVRKDLSSSVLMIGTTLTESIKNNIETKNWQLNSLCDRGCPGDIHVRGERGCYPGLQTLLMFQTKSMLFATT